MRIQQANIGAPSLPTLPVTNGQVQGRPARSSWMASPSPPPIVLEFLDPSDDGEEGGALSPPAIWWDDLEVPASVVKSGVLKATPDQRRHPHCVRHPRTSVAEGTELREQINTDPEALARFEAIRLPGPCA